MKQLTVSAWLLIFSAVAEPRISGKPAKSREIHNNVRNTAKFARNLIKYLSTQHIWNLFRLLGLFNCRNLANLPWNFITTMREKCLKICPEKSHKIGCFSAKLAVKISAKSVSENPVKFYFRDLDRTILQGFWYQIWSFKNIADRSRYKFGDKLPLFMRFGTFCMTKAKQEKMKFLF